MTQGNRRSTGDRSGAARRTKPELAWALVSPMGEIEAVRWSVDTLPLASSSSRVVRVRIVPVVPPARRKPRRKS